MRWNQVQDSRQQVARIHNVRHVQYGIAAHSPLATNTLVTNGIARLIYILATLCSKREMDKIIINSPRHTRDANSNTRALDINRPSSCTRKKKKNRKFRNELEPARNKRTRGTERARIECYMRKKKKELKNECFVRNHFFRQPLMWLARAQPAIAFAFTESPDCFNFIKPANVVEPKRSLSYPRVLSHIFSLVYTFIVPSMYTHIHKSDRSDGKCSSFTKQSRIKCDFA